MSSEMKVCVATSRKWKGEEIAREITEKIKRETPEPKFILLFSTIHHKDEFKPMLEGIKKEFPDAPLVGGTVAGFMNQDGVFTRGVTAMAVQDPEMQVAVGVGRNVKRNPKKAARQAIKGAACKGVSGKNTTFFFITAGTEVARIPFSHSSYVIKSGVTSSLIRGGMPFLEALVQKGRGKEEKLFSLFSERFPTAYFVGLSTLDDLKLKQGFQFYDTRILKESVVLLCMVSDNALDIVFDHSSKRISPEMRLIADPKKNLVRKINERPAADELLETLGFRIPEITDDLFLKTFPYFAFEANAGGVRYPVAFSMLLGGDVFTVFPLKSKTTFLLANTIGKIVSAPEEIFEGDVLGLFSVACATRLMAARRKLYLLHESIRSKLEKPFLVVYSIGEYYALPYDKPVCASESTVYTVYRRRVK